MPIIEASVNVSKPVEKVFEFITNFDNQKKLNNMLTDIIVSGPVAVGTKVKYKGTVMGRAFETENEIVTLEPNQKLGIKTKAAPPASDVTNTYLLEDTGGGTKLTAQMDTVITGGFPGVEEMVKNQLISTLNQTLAAMKQAIES
jgi:carbon monoxide dehydrogenase subunit G